jgi:hypothetical protein
MANFALGLRKRPLQWPAMSAAETAQHFLPLPMVAQSKEVFRLLTEKDLPLSIGRLGITTDNAALLSAYVSMAVKK